MPGEYVEARGIVVVQPPLVAPVQSRARLRARPPWVDPRRRGARLHNGAIMTVRRPRSPLALDRDTEGVDPLVEDLRAPEPGIGRRELDGLGQGRDKVAVVAVDDDGRASVEEGDVDGN